MRHLPAGLKILSQAFRPAQVYATDFMVDNTQMAFIISDQEQNVVVYKYQPETRESLGGKTVIIDRRATNNVTSFVV